MNLNKLKYITALLLLLIFPISSFGINVSIHKCKSKGTIHYSLFKYNKNSNSCTCDFEKGVNQKIKQNTIKNVNNENESGLLKSSNIHTEQEKTPKLIQKHSCCSNTNKVQPEPEIKKHSCCTQSSMNSQDSLADSEINNNISSKIVDTKNNTIPESGINFRKPSCCSNSNLSLALQVYNLTIDKIQFNTNSFNLCPYNPLKFNCGSQSSNKLFVKYKDYPLKKPVYSIISYIHFTSNNEDEGDASFSSLI